MLKLLTIFLISTPLFAGCGGPLKLLIVDSHLDQSLQKSITAIPMEDSFAKKNEALLEKLYQIEQQLPGKSKAQRILQEELGREPTLEEMLLKIKRLYEVDFLKPLSDLSKEYPSFKSINDEVIYKVKHTIDRIEDNIAKQSERYIKEFDPHNDDHLQIIAGYVSRGYGEIGEAVSIAKTKNFIAHSMKFNHLNSTELNRLIAHKVDIARTRLKYLDIDYLTEKFPHIFRTKNYKGKEIGDPKEIVDRGLDWILTKEIDVVSKVSNQKIAWTEVKNYDFPYGIEHLFKSHHSKGHSVGDQLQGYLEIVEFLNLKEIVEIRVHFEAGLLPKARNAIEAMGVRVVD